MSLPSLQETFDSYMRGSARTRAKAYLKAVHQDVPMEEIRAFVDSHMPLRGTAQSARIAKARGKIQYSYAQFGPSPGVKADGTPKKGKIVAYDAAPGGAANKAAMQAAVAEFRRWVDENPGASDADLQAQVARLSKK